MSLLPPESAGHVAGCLQLEFLLRKSCRMIAKLLHDFTALQPVHLLTGHFLQGTLRDPVGFHDFEHTRGWLQLQVVLCIPRRQLPSAFTALQPAHQLVANPYSKHGCILCC